MLINTVLLVIFGIIISCFISQKLNFERIFNTIAISTISIGITSLVLSMFGLLYEKNLLILLVFVDLFFTLFLVFSRRKLFIFNFDKKNLLIIPLFFIFIPFFYFFDFNYLNFRESGQNLHTGILIAKNHSIFISEEITEKLGTTSKDLFFKVDNQYKRFPTTGSFLIDDKNIQKPGYYPFYSVYIALAYLFGNLKTISIVNGLFSVLSLLSLFYFAKRSFGIKTALISCIILSISFTQIYSVWYLGNEIFNQFLALYFLYLITTKQKSKGCFFYFILHTAATALLLVRPENLLILVPTYIYLIFKVKKGNIFLIIFSLVSSFLIFYYYKLFFSEQFVKYFNYDLSQKLKIAPIFIILAFLVILFCIIFKKTIYKLITQNYKIFTFSLIYLIYLIYSVFSYKWDYEYNNLNNLNFITWYWGGLLVLLSILGMVSLFKQNLSKKILVFLFITTPYVLYFIQEIHNYVLHPWTIRRYVPLVFPFLIIVASNYLIKTVLYKSKFIFIIVVVAVVTNLISNDLQLLNYYQKNNFSIIKQLSSINNEFNEKSVFIFCLDNYETGIHQPLYSIFNRTVFLLNRKIINYQGSSRLKVTDLEEIVFNEKLFFDFENAISELTSFNKNIYLINPSVELLKKIDQSSKISVFYNKQLSLNFISPTLTYNYLPQEVFIPIEQKYEVYEIKEE